MGPVDEEQLSGLYEAREKLVLAESLLELAERLFVEWGYKLNAREVRGAIRHIREVLDD